MTKFEEEFNYLIELSGKVLIGQVDAEVFEKNRVSFFEKYETDQQQALPVVPECVAGAIESIPDHYSAFEAIDLIKSKVEILTEENKDWLPVYNWLCEGVENQDVFALAFITRKYQVEKPQLFYLKATDSRGHEYLNLDTSEKSIFLSGKKQYDGFQTKFTLEEIKGNSLLKPFIDKIVPVEDGE